MASDPTWPGVAAKRVVITGATGGIGLAGAVELGRRGARVLYGSRLVEVIAGVSAAAGSDWDAAGEHFERALAEARRTHNQLEEADAFRFRAMMLIDRGADQDRQKAREDLETAQELYRLIGMPRHIELARGLLNSS